MLLAVAAAAAVMLVAGTASAGPSEASIADLRATASSGSASVTWTTSTPMRGRVSYGIGGTYLYTTLEPTAATQHTVELPDLAPSSTYDFRVDSSSGKATATASGRVTTGAPPVDPRFDVAGTHITADGSLFFPIMSYEQCAATIARALTIGVNTFVQVPFTGCGPSSAGITPPYVLSDNYAGASGAGWYLPDEPDGWGITPEQMPKLPAPASTGRLRVLNITQHFFSGQAPINDRFDRNDYKRFAAGADVIGFDMYPIVKFCGRVPLLDVFRAQRELMTTYAPGKPTFQWIETSKMTGECASLQITAGDRQRGDVARDRRRRVRHRLLHEQLDERRLGSLVVRPGNRGAARSDGRRACRSSRPRSAPATTAAWSCRGTAASRRAPAR